MKYTGVLYFVFFSSILQATEEYEQGITADRLQQIAGDAEVQKRMRANRIDPSDMNSLLDYLLPKKRTKIIEVDIKPINNVVNNTDTQKKDSAQGKFNYTDIPKPEIKSQKKVSSKYGKPEPNEPEIVINQKNQEAETATASYSDKLVEKKIKKPPYNKKKTYRNEYTYIAPSRTQSSTNEIYASKLKRKFGIRIGTWIKGRLNRSTTNSDPGLIEVHIREEIQGDYRSLPVGTILFCQKKFNKGTRRLDMEIIKALLPSGEEFDLTALVYDEQRKAGLRGVVIENDNRSIESGLTKGVLNAGGAIASLNTGSTAGIIIDSTIESVTDNKKIINSAKNPSVAYTIHVPPQIVQVQIQITF